MNAVMLSIRPEWCEKIAQGKKTIEVRKTKPKLDTPFKCYIYCTERGRPLVYGDVRCWGGYREEYTQTYGYSKEKARKIWDVYNGHVMGEFVCDKIFDIAVEISSPDELAGYPFLGTALTDKQILNYLGNGKTGYGWHISDLVIYDTPMKLSEFRVPCAEYDRDYPKCGNCEYYYCESNESVGFYDECCCDGLKYMTRPPQSWCYVEELE